MARGGLAQHVAEANAPLRARHESTREHERTTGRYDVKDRRSQ